MNILQEFLGHVVHAFFGQVEMKKRDAPENEIVDAREEVKINFLYFQLIFHLSLFHDQLFSLLL